MSDNQTNARLFFVAENEGNKALLELGDEIVMSVLLMRHAAISEGMPFESHEKWFDRLVKRAEATR